jgi:predicted amidohydrolase YtcJ
MHLVLQHVQQPDVESWRIAVEWAEGVLAAEGVTASKESYDRAECRGILAAYGLLREQNNLRHRPVVLCRPDSATDLGDVAEWQLVTANSATRPGPRPTPRFGGVKLFMDGSLVARTAWMHDPYPSDLGISQQDRGYPAMAPDDFGHLARLANERGLHVAVHAIGDQAIDTVLDVFAKNTAGDGPKTLAPALIHALVPSDTAIARMQMMRISVETQPALLHVLGAGYARALEPQRLRRLLPLRSMINAGLAVSFGSDWPTCAPSPRLGMWAACTRISRALSPDKDVFEPNERINVKEALRAYTSTAASCIGMEEQLGSIELGKFADLVVWEGDILRTSPERLVDLGIRTTIVGGQIVFDAAAE